MFAKPPVPGKVKTRLAAKLGPARAAQIASAMLQDVWSAVSTCPGLLPILATVEYGLFPVDASPQNIWLQRGTDLGDRLESIFRQALLGAPAAIAIGADSPLLTTQHLLDALSQLETHDAVLGLCPDGGFYLLGLRRCPEGLLAGLPWSTPQTADATLQRLRERAFSVAHIPSLFDVDTPDDLALLAEALIHNPMAAPVTRRLLLDVH